MYLYIHLYKIYKKAIVQKLQTYKRIQSSREDIHKRGINNISINL